MSSETTDFEQKVLRLEAIRLQAERLELDSQGRLDAGNMDQAVGLAAELQDLLADLVAGRQEIARQIELHKRYDSALDVYRRTLALIAK